MAKRINDYINRLSQALPVNTDFLRLLDPYIIKINKQLKNDKDKDGYQIPDSRTLILYTNLIPIIKSNPFVIPNYWLLLSIIIGILKITKEYDEKINTYIEGILNITDIINKIKYGSFERINDKYNINAYEKCKNIYDFFKVEHPDFEEYLTKITKDIKVSDSTGFNYDSLPKCDDIKTMTTDDIINDIKDPNSKYIECINKKLDELYDKDKDFNNNNVREFIIKLLEKTYN